MILIKYHHSDVSGDIVGLSRPKADYTSEQDLSFSIKFKKEEVSEDSDASKVVRL